MGSRDNVRGRAAIIEKAVSLGKTLSQKSWRWDVIAVRAE
jgi:hypothetical protein